MCPTSVGVGMCAGGPDIWRPVGPNAPNFSLASAQQVATVWMACVFGKNSLFEGQAAGLERVTTVSELERQQPL